MDKIILSICIPTYNRAEILDNTLSKLVLEKAFQSRKIEICISDNASPDNTELVVKKYSDKFENIFYHKNQVNTGIIDGNFPIVASLASGTFIKFLNDYASFIPGELDKIIYFIESNSNTKPVIFFSNNSLLDKTSELIYCDSLNTFVGNASYWITWVLAAGFWKDDFLAIKDRDRSIDKFMWCPDNYLRLVQSGRKTIIYNTKFCIQDTLKKKGGYNFFNTFGVDYLSMYDEYVETKSLSKRIYNIEKYRLFRYYLINWYNDLILIKNDVFFFEKGNAFKILLKNYKFKPYFYIGLIYLYVRYFFKKIIKH